MYSSTTLDTTVKLRCLLNFLKLFDANFPVSGFIQVWELYKILFIQ